MSQALDEVCVALEIADGDKQARQAIAERIVTLAKRGERNPMQLRHRGLVEAALRLCHFEADARSPWRGWPRLLRNEAALSKADGCRAARGNDEYKRPVRVVAFNTGEGGARDVSKEVAREILNRMSQRGDDLLSSTKNFVAFPVPGYVRAWN
jgi:hypothetical protein